jgi:hypothetical protein
MSMYRMPPATPTCARHRVAPAVVQCSRCRANVCTPCSTYLGLGVFCSRCTVIARHRRIWRRIILFAIVPEAMATVASLILAAQGAPRTAAPIDLLIACPEPCKMVCAPSLVESAYAQDPARTDAILRDGACEAVRRSLADQLDQNLVDRDWRAAGQSAQALLAAVYPPFYDSAGESAAEALRSHDLDAARLHALASLTRRPGSPVSYPILLALFRAAGDEQTAEDLVAWVDRRPPGWCPPGYVAPRFEHWVGKTATTRGD